VHRLLRGAGSVDIRSPHALIGEIGGATSRALEDLREPSHSKPEIFKGKANHRVAVGLSVS